ncbi:MAG TPA: cell wall hydrolase [Allosphingosinicella sp.]|nr:cell wall hydrolase [Allosphingosinicella sp.]
MIRPLRGAAFAVAAALTAASFAWGGPLQALESDAAPVETPWFAHGDAAAQISDLGLNGEPERPASLEAHVAELADGETRGAEEECLANAVYFEARGESLEGQLAVAEVVLNRAASGRYPASLCEVVRQPWQFSFVRRGVMPRADRGSDSWRKAVAVARIARSGARRLLARNVLWYHANYVAPSWGRRLARSGQIGAHIFYR